MSARTLAPTLVALVAICGCSASPRAPESWCMQRAVDSLALDGLSDARRHCLAAAVIAERCGAGTALLAGQMKELADVFGPGDASRRDLAANAAGRRCAGRVSGTAALDTCCADAGY